MKISISYNKKSIDNAIQTIENAKKQLYGVMINELLVECCNEIIRLANEKLDLTDIGSNVKTDIQSSWTFEPPIDKKIRLVNTAEKAVYVEFGVGIVGQQDPHPNAAQEGYEYNVPSPSKRADNSWKFATQVENLDLPNKDVRKYETEDNNIVVFTKGTAATMFVYQSIMDFKDFGLAKKIWKNIKKKYWG